MLGNNMFAYCLNNPENYSDPTGHCTLCMANRLSYQLSAKADCGCGIGGGYSIGGSHVVSGNKGIVGEMIDFISNTDEQAVLNAEHFVFYKCIPVVKLPIGDEAFSVGLVIIMGNDVQDVQTVRHEYGHSVHSELVGMKKYIKYVFVPSLIGYWTGVEYDMYYSLPWEYAAEILGKVISDGGTYNYASIADPLFYLYFVATLVAPN